MSGAEEGRADYCQGVCQPPGSVQWAGEHSDPQAPTEVQTQLGSQHGTASPLKRGSSCSHTTGMEEAKSSPLRERRGEKASQKRLQKMVRPVSLSFAL